MVSATHDTTYKQLTCFEPSRLFLLLLTYPLLLLLAETLFLASLENGRTALRLFLLHLVLRILLHLGKLLASPRADSLLYLVEVAQHASKALLRLDVVEVSLAMRLDTGLLRLLEDSTIIGLLLLVVLREKRALLLAVGTFDVVEALGEDAHTLV